MKVRLNGLLIVGGAALIMMTGCVSSKKYKASQAELAKVRTDSGQLAQQVASLNGNVNDLQGKNKTLQQSLDNSTSTTTAQQKSIDYYKGYFKEQQDTLAAVNQDVQSALTQAGVTNGDVSQNGNAIYVRLDEKDLFKKNSSMITPAGQKVLDNLAMVVKSRDGVNVTVGSGDSAIGWASTDNMPAGSMDMPARKHHRVHYATASASASGGTGGAANGGNGSASGASSKTAAATPSTGSTATAEPVHKKVHHHYSSEGSTAMHSGAYTGNHSWSLKQGRMVKVADRFLVNGVPKIHVTLQRPPMNGTPQSTAIKIIIMPVTRPMTPQNASAMANQ
jgi:outer membrane protein OmpA-like peptidoglycan-associated protein